MEVSNKNVIEWVLRIGVFLTFFGHGIVAIMGNPDWLKYIEVVGISNYNAQIILIFIGYLDFFVAFITLLRPNKYILIWASIWAFSTALIRPISGESILEFIERGSNWALPLGLYFYLKFLNNKRLQKKINTLSDHK